MKILFLSQIIPFPLDAGPRIRSYYVLRHLAARGHDLTLAAFARETDQMEALSHLKGFCRRVATLSLKRSVAGELRGLSRSVVQGTPFIIARDEIRRFAQMIENLTLERRFDAVHSDQLWMAPYALQARDSAGIPSAILDQHNAVFQVIERLAVAEQNRLKRLFWRMESRKLRCYERQVCSQFDQVVWVSDQDRKALLGTEQDGFRDSRNTELSGRVKSLTIPISVDPELNPLIERRRRPRRVTFLGGLHWPPNAQGIEWFIQNAWSEVSRANPDALLTIIGKKPPRKLTARVGRDNSIEVTGYVEDLSPLLKETAVFIVPLLAGGGMRVKILDAWCWGLPVITTTIGGEGLHIRNGCNALVADDAREFGSAVTRVFQDRDLGDRLASCGRVTAVTEYNWQHNYRQWDQVYRPEQ